MRTEIICSLIVGLYFLVNRQKWLAIMALTASMVMLSACSSTNELLDEYNQKYEARLERDKAAFAELKAIPDVEERRTAIAEFKALRQQREMAIGQLYIEQGQQRIQSDMMHYKYLGDIGRAAIDRKGAYYRNYNQAQRPIVVLMPGGQ